jgi:hypothetical protein
MKARKEFSQGSQQFDKAQCNIKQHMSIKFSTRTSYGFGRTVAYQKGGLLIVFRFFSNEIPKHTSNYREDLIIKPYHKCQLLRRA